MTKPGLLVHIAKNINYSKMTAHTQHTHRVFWVNCV